MIKEKTIVRKGSERCKVGPRTDLPSRGEFFDACKNVHHRAFAVGASLLVAHVNKPIRSVQDGISGSLTTSLRERCRDIVSQRAKR